MPTIDQLAERVAPVSPSASVADVYGWFAKNPDALALPVVDNGVPVGLIDRQDFMFKLAEPLGHSRYGSRPVSHIMDPEPAVVEYDVKVSAFSDIILKSRHSTLMRGFVVTRKGSYLGVGTVISLLHVTNNDQAVKIAQLEAKIAGLTAANISNAQSDFVNLLKREFDAPLRCIQTFSQLLERNASNPVAMHQIQAIQNAAEDIQKLLGNASDLVLLKTGSIPLSPEPTVLRDFMDQIGAEWSQRGKAEGVPIMISYEGDTELAALIDRVRFQQTYDALIDCSLHLVRNGVMEVGLKAVVVKDMVQLSARVRDDGPGLDPEQLASGMLDPSVGGNLALTTAHQLLEALGGKLWCANNTGRGSTYGFDVLVPRHIEQAADADNVTHLDGLDFKATPRVLIADDNTTNRVVAQALCEMFGCICETVEDGVQAVEAVLTGDFDLVLMDIKMPRMDGVEATRHIRALAAPANNVPVIALTANADPDDAQGYINAGMLCVVEKPIKPERLRMAMNLALSPVEEQPAQTPEIMRQTA